MIRTRPDLLHSDGADLNTQTGAAYITATLVKHRVCAVSLGYFSENYTHTPSTRNQCLEPSGI